MMNGIERIRSQFAAGKVNVGYLTAGDGGITKSLQVALALIAGGVNMLEIAIPFSDPVADGPVIQRAAQRALTAGTTVQEVLWLAAQIRQHSDIPLILFSYFNPILSALSSAHWRPDFLSAAAAAGIDGLLIVDCPPEEAAIFHQTCLTQHIAPIYIITPATSLARIQQIDRQAHGFLYYACRKGTTGVRDALPADFAEKMRMIKSVVHLPVIVGFGIATRQMTEQVLQYADGAVVASRFVQAIEEGASVAELTRLAREIYPESAKKIVNMDSRENRC